MKGFLWTTDNGPRITISTNDQRPTTNGQRPTNKIHIG